METSTFDITIRVPTSADNASIAAALRMRAGLFEGLTGKEAASRKNTDAVSTDTAKPVKTDKKAAAKVEKKAAPTEETFDLGEEVAGDDLGLEDDAAAETVEAETTLEEVRAVFKTFATSDDPKKGRDNAAKLLMKNFKIKSLLELQPADYAKALKLVGG